MTRRIIPILLFICLFASVVHAAVEPAPRSYVEDRASVLDGQTATALTALLQELEQKTNARVIVLTVATTGGVDISQYAFERADEWKFGPNRNSASALIVVAVSQ